MHSSSQKTERTQKKFKINQMLEKDANHEKQTQLIIQQLQKNSDQQDIQHNIKNHFSNSSLKINMEKLGTPQNENNKKLKFETFSVINKHSQQKPIASIKRRSFVINSPKGSIVSNQTFYDTQKQQINNSNNRNLSNINQQSRNNSELNIFQQNKKSSIQMSKNLSPIMKSQNQSFFNQQNYRQIQKSEANIYQEENNGNDKKRNSVNFQKLQSASKSQSLSNFQFEHGLNFASNEKKEKQTIKHQMSQNEDNHFNQYFLNDQQKNIKKIQISPHKNTITNTQSCFELKQQLLFPEENLSQFKSDNKNQQKSINFNLENQQILLQNNKAKSHRQTNDPNIYNTKSHSNDQKNSRQSHIDIIQNLNHIYDIYESSDKQISLKLVNKVFKVLTQLRSLESKFGDKMKKFYEIIKKMIMCENIEMINLANATLYCSKHPIDELIEQALDNLNQQNQQQRGQQIYDIDNEIDPKMIQKVQELQQSSLYNFKNMKDLDLEINNLPNYLCAKIFQDLFQKMLGYIQNLYKQINLNQQKFDKEKINFENEIQEYQQELDIQKQNEIKALEHQKAEFALRFKEYEDKYKSFIEQVNQAHEENKKINSELEVNKLSYQAVESKLGEFQKLSFALGNELSTIKEQLEKSQQEKNDLEIKNEIKNSTIYTYKEQLQKYEQIDLSVFEDIYEKLGIMELINPLNDKNIMIQDQILEVQQKIMQKIEHYHQIEQELQQLREKVAKKKKKQQLGVSNQSNNMKLSSMKQSMRSSYLDNNNKKQNSQYFSNELESQPITPNRRQTELMQQTAIIINSVDKSQSRNSTFQKNFNTLQVSVSDLTMEKSSPFIQRKIKEITEEKD